MFDKLKRFFSFNVPAVIDEEAKVVSVPAFEIPLDEPLLSAKPIQGAIEVKRESDKAVVQVKLKKKPTRKVAKKKASKKRLKKSAGK